MLLLCLAYSKDYILHMLYDIIVLEVFTIFYMTVTCDLCDILCDKFVTVVTMTSC